MAVITEDDKAIRNLQHRLVKEGVLKRSELAANADLIESVVRYAKTGVSIQQYNHGPLLGTTETYQVPATNPVDGKPVTRITHDPLEIFCAEYNIRKREVEEQQKVQKELIDAAETDFYYWDRKTPNSFEARYDSTKGKIIDKTYFMENLYRCGHPSCMARFKNLGDEYRQHIRLHGMMI